MQENIQTIIIGAGVAGMTAALYLKRAGCEVLLIEKEVPGGQITRTATIENYPGILKIEGPDLAMEFYNQVTSWKIPFSFSEVLSVKQIENGYFVETARNTYSCQNLVIATGRNPKRLNIKNEEKLSGRGISWCAVCDGPLYKNKNVAVVGGGRSALEETIYLSKLCNQVTLIHRRDDFRADSELIDDVRQIENVRMICNTKVEEFTEQDNRLYSLILNGEINEELKVEGCFEFIGQEPTTNFISNLGILNSNGYVDVNQNFETSLPNLYACGDCIEKELYQIVVACSEGANVANQIMKKEI